MEFIEYPKSMYRDAEVTTVTSREEEDALGESWVDGHTFFSAKADEKPKRKSR